MADIYERVERDPMSEDEWAAWLEARRAEDEQWQAEYDAKKASMAEADVEYEKARRRALRYYRASFAAHSFLMMALVAVTYVVAPWVALGMAAAWSAYFGWAIVHAATGE